MTPSLKIAKALIARLSTYGIHNEEEKHGKVYGILAKDSLYILGIEIASKEVTIKDLVNVFPAEVDICGRIQLGDGSFDEQVVKKSLNHIDVTDNPIFINYNISTGEIIANFFINNKLEDANFNIVTESEILSEFLHIRLESLLPFSSELTQETIRDNFLKLRKSVASGLMTFNFNNTNIYLLGGASENGIVGVTGSPTIGEIFSKSNELNDGSGGRKKKNANIVAVEKNVFNVNMLKRVTRAGDIGNFKDHAPVCVLEKKKSRTVNFTVRIDALTMLHREIKIGRLYEILVESAIRHLKLLESSILSSLENVSTSILSAPQTFHFYSSVCGHFVTQIYQESATDNQLLPARRSLHQIFLLPLTRPLFRRANKFTFNIPTNHSQPLINPHEGVKLTENCGKISLVKGKYLYYHYGQNNMDDKGWGCAYRSLQTLASWFKLQGYTEKNVPDFTDIQKCLVDIGDKSANFVGSKQWIGSTEVSFVLDTILGISSKILYVSSGEEMGSKGQELLNHFEMHGSPVMIGGGVLAHTILGVDYNFETGNLKFLILDPHYTGSEDLSTIQNKGWCGWKGVDFWDKTAYYNMCLPQVPNGF